MKKDYEQVKRLSSASEGVAFFIAENSLSSVRALEGALRLVIANAQTLFTRARKSRRVHIVEEFEKIAGKLA